MLNEDGSLKALSKEEIKKIREDYVKEMAENTKKNPCLQARKCMLVPYDPKKQIPPGKKTDLKSYKYKGKSYKEKRTGKDLRSLLGLGYSSGCCPGQTGHHLIPTSWAKDACPNYDKGKAPVVCAEGSTQHEGTHGSLHSNLDKIISEKHGLKLMSESASLTKDEAVNSAVESHQQMYTNAGDCADCFGRNPCSKKCLKAQLNDFYDKCKGKFNAKLLTGGRDGVDDERAN